MCKYVQACTSTLCKVCKYVLACGHAASCDAGDSKDCQMTASSPPWRRALGSGMSNCGGVKAFPCPGSVPGRREEGGAKTNEQNRSIVHTDPVPKNDPWGLSFLRVWPTREGHSDQLQLRMCVCECSGHALDRAGQGRAGQAAE
jgi:hypothetical protein